MIQIGESSNGRTTVSEAVYLGSNPSSPTMHYEVMMKGNRVEFVEASCKEEALMKANKKCEGSETLSYLREKESTKMIWVYSYFI